MELQSFKNPFYGTLLNSANWATGGPISYEVVKIYKVGKHNKLNSLTAMGSGGNKKTSWCTFQLGTYRQTYPPWWASANSSSTIFLVRPDPA